MGRCILAPSVGVTNELDNEGVDEKAAHLTHGTPLSSEPVQDGRALWRGRCGAALGSGGSTLLQQ